MKRASLVSAVALLALIGCANRGSDAPGAPATKPELQAPPHAYFSLNAGVARELNRPGSGSSVELDISKLGLSETEEGSLRRAALRGELVVRGETALREDKAVLVVDDAWQAASSAPASGTYFLAYATEASSLKAMALNQNQELVSLDGFDWARPETAQNELDEAWAALRGESAIFVGRLEAVTNAAGSTERLRATQFFRHLKHRTTTGCHSSGCYGETCVPSDKSVFSLCEPKPEHACYERFGNCERAPDGRCGFARTAELADCLEKTRR